MKCLIAIIRDSFYFYKRNLLDYVFRKLYQMGITPDILEIEYIIKRNNLGFNYACISNELLERIKNIRPDFVVGVDNCVVLWGLNFEYNGRLVNIFPFFNIPAIFAWDYCFDQSMFMTGALEIIKEVIKSHYILHFSHDKGDIQQIKEITGMENMNVNYLISYNIDLYIKNLYSDETNEEYLFDISHCGNIYLSLLKNNPLFLPNGNIKEFIKSVIIEKFLNLHKPLWNIYIENINKSNLSLKINEPLFWVIYRYISAAAGNTYIRMKILESIKNVVNFFGCYADPGSVNMIKNFSNIKLHSPVRPGDELANIYRKSKINIIVSNLINQNGISPKLIECLASGGFALIDPRPALYEFFGEEIESIIYRSIDELNEKINYYLTHKNERKDILHILREKLKNYLKDKGSILEFQINKMKSLLKG